MQSRTVKSKLRCISAAVNTDTLPRETPILKLSSKKCGICAVGHRSNFSARLSTRTLNLGRFQDRSRVTPPPKMPKHSAWSVGRPVGQIFPRVESNLRPPVAMTFEILSELLSRHNLEMHCFLLTSYSVYSAHSATLEY